MKPAHEMNYQERQEYREFCMENARSLMNTNHQMAIANRDPKLKAKYHKLEENWHREYERLKAIVNRGA